jgi:hypothetical protein
MRRLGADLEEKHELRGGMTRDDDEVADLAETWPWLDPVTGRSYQRDWPDRAWPAGRSCAWSSGCGGGCGS